MMLHYFVYSLFLTALISTILHVSSSESSEGSDGSGKRKSAKYQKAAINAWVKQLTDADFDIQLWSSITKKTQPQHIFDIYTQKLSDIFIENKAKVNFMLIGACDGTHDKTIRDRFIPNTNWNGIFVEPISLNYKALNVYLETNQLTDRSITIQAAVTDTCVGPNITLKVASFEKKNPNAPHWLRREINTILRSPQEKLDPDWIKEDVPCKTASDIMLEWTTQYYLRQPIMKRRVEPRIHVLKIDAEGHDFEVLSSFLLRPDLTPEALPLLICFEAKDIIDKLPIVRELMRNKGYVVSEGTTNDGFAILRNNATVITSSGSNNGDSQSSLISDSGTSGKKNKKGKRGKKRRGEDGSAAAASGGEGGTTSDRSGRDERGGGGRKRGRGGKGKKGGRGKGGEERPLLTA